MDRERERPRFPAGVTSRSARSVEITFEYRGVRCRETIKLAPTPANLKRVAQHRAAILDAIARGSFDYATTFPDSPNRYRFSAYQGDGYRLDDYLTSWIDRQKTHLKASTWADYDRTVRRRLIPQLGKMALSDIKRPAVRDWLDTIKASNKTLANIQTVLRSALRDAVDDELIESNPLREWVYTRKEAPREADDVDPLDAGEMAAVLAACKHEQARNLFEFAFWSGLRTSELVALEWGDIDFRRGTVRVSKAKTRAAKSPELPKTRKGTRDVTLLAPALAAIERQKAWTFLAGQRVFHNPIKNTPWTNDQKVRLAWVAALKAAGIRYRRPYQTRHTYASMMLTAGENPAWIAGQMGHADLAMLFRSYGRWIKSATPDAGQKAVAMFSKSCGPDVAQTG